MTTFGSLTDVFAGMISSAVRRGGDIISLPGFRRIGDDAEEQARNEVRDGIEPAFKRCNSEAAITATTDSGTTYQVHLTICNASDFISCADRSTGIIYACRPGVVSINGQRYKNIVVGFDRGTRTLFVGDPTNNQRIARSSTIRNFSVR